MAPEPSDAAYRRFGELAYQMLMRIAQEDAEAAVSMLPSERHSS